MDGHSQAQANDFSVLSFINESIDSTIKSDKHKKMNMYASWYCIFLSFDINIS